MKLIFNFNNNRFVIESHLKRVDGKNNDNGIIVNVYEVDITCGDKKANFIFSDVSLDGKARKNYQKNDCFVH